MQLPKDVKINFPHFVKSDYKESWKEGTNEGGGGRKGELHFHVNQTGQLDGCTLAQIKIILLKSKKRK